MPELTKVIVVIEVELEKPVHDLGGEICKRIAMHGDVHDANVLSIGSDLSPTHAPKGGSLSAREGKYPMGVVLSNWAAASVSHKLAIPTAELGSPYNPPAPSGTGRLSQGASNGYSASGQGREPWSERQNQLGAGGSGLGRADHMVGENSTAVVKPTP